MLTRVNNRHMRRIDRPSREVFALLEELGTESDRLWPAPSIPFERTPGPLRVGETRERHGIIRAVLSEYEPERSLVWRAELSFLEGTHGFEIVEVDGGCEVAHVLDARLAWWFVPVWHVRIRALHDRIVEGLLDQLAKSTT